MWTAQSLVLKTDFDMTFKVQSHGWFVEHRLNLVMPGIYEWQRPCILYLMGCSVSKVFYLSHHLSDSRSRSTFQTTFVNQTVGSELQHILPLIV